MKTVLHTLTYYVVTFPDGEYRSVTVDDTCDVVQVQHGNAYFESDAYHLPGWCQENGFTCHTGKLTIELPRKEL